RSPSIELTVLETCEQIPGQPCLRFLNDLQIDDLLGGQYTTEEGEECASGFEIGSPWHLTDVAPRVHCQDGRGLPLSPLRDGVSRSRHIRAIDGVLVDETTLLVFIEERIDGFPEPTYGYLLLEHTSTHRTDLGYEGAPPPETTPPTPPQRLDRCPNEDPNDIVRHLLVDGDDQTPPLPEELMDALAYRELWLSGQAPARAPSLCTGSSEPFCVDLEHIDRLDAGLSCLVSLWQQADGDQDLLLEPEMRQALEVYVTQELAEHAALISELWLVLGDQAFVEVVEAPFTTPLPSALFEGTDMEEEFALGELFGYTLVRLHSASQLHQQAFDRLLDMVPLIEMNPRAEGMERFLTLTSRASTHKGLAWAEIADRYLRLDRDELAMATAQHALAQLHQEGNLLQAYLRQLEDDTALQHAQERHQAAVHRLLRTYQAIQLGTDPEGHTLGNVPYPTIEGGVPGTAFELVLRRTRSREQLLQDRTQQVMASDRATFEQAPNEEAHLSTLNELRDNLLDNLTGVCGAFEADNNQIYPAIRAYASASETLSFNSDPCGRSNGEIAMTVEYIQQSAPRFQELLRQYHNAVDELYAAVDDTATQCNLLLNSSDFQLTIDDRIANLESLLRASHQRVSTLSLEQLSWHQQLQCDPQTNGCGFRLGYDIDHEALEDALISQRNVLLAHWDGQARWGVGSCETAQAIANRKTMEL
ncbi:MAG: hypothetical protein AAFX99_31645, partial [Myxococcota bacterium]